MNFLSFSSLILGRKKARFQNGIAKVDIIFYPANFFEVFFRIFSGFFRDRINGIDDLAEYQHFAKKAPSGAFFEYFSLYYIIPPAGIAGAAGAGSGMSTIPHSVVRNMPATEAAFSRATRATLVGSMTPASYILT